MHGHLNVQNLICLSEKEIVLVRETRSLPHTKYEVFFMVVFTKFLKLYRSDDGLANGPKLVT
jgi:hypothetical protein